MQEKKIFRLAAPWEPQRRFWEAFSNEILCSSFHLLIMQPQVCRTFKSFSYREAVVLQLDQEPRHLMMHDLKEGHSLMVRTLFRPQTIQSFWATSYFIHYVSLRKSNLWFSWFRSNTVDTGEAPDCNLWKVPLHKLCGDVVERFRKTVIPRIKLGYPCFHIRSFLWIWNLKTLLTLIVSIRTLEPSDGFPKYYFLLK